MTGVIGREWYHFTKDFEWLPDATANTSHNQNDPVVNSSKFSQKGALKQMGISANKSDVLIFLYQVLHFWHTHLSLRNYSPLLKILKAFKR